MYRLPAKRCALPTVWIWWIGFNTNSSTPGSLQDNTITRRSYWSIWYVFFIWLKYCCHHLVFVVLGQIYYKISNRLCLSCIQYLLMLLLLHISVFQGGTYSFLCTFHKRLWFTYKNAVIARIPYYNVHEVLTTFI